MAAFPPPAEFASEAFEMKWSKEEGAGEQVYLLYGGKTGWLGGLLTGLLRASGKTVHHGEARLENREAIMRDFETYKPTRVLNAAGVTGRPNVDWCEDNKQTVIRTNVIGTLNLADVCWNAGIHCTLYATGCIFEYDDSHVIGGSGFTEDERANFDGSFYSFTKVVAPLCWRFALWVRSVAGTQSTRARARDGARSSSAARGTRASRERGDRSQNEREREQVGAGRDLAAVVVRRNVRDGPIQRPARRVRRAMRRAGSG